MQPQPVRGYRFADFTLDLARRRLTGSGPEPLPLSGRAFEVLAYLVANRDRMVPKRELMDAVWPRMVVEENNLTQAISNVRRALGDSRDSPAFIATVAGRGYHFVAEVRALADLPPDAPPTAAVPAESGTTGTSSEQVTTAPDPSAVTTAPSAAQAAPTATGLSRRSLLLGAGLAAGAAIAAALWSRGERASPRSLPSSIAVLPFKPLLPQARNEAIEVGMAELLINRLSPLPGVVVKPLSSVRRYSAIDQDPAQAGRELDVEAVVDGTVQIAGNEVRLTARLLDVATGQSLWAGNFTQQLGDFFAMQDALVTQLVSALAVHAPLQGLPSMAGGTADTEAWQLYANGRYQLERRDRYGVARAKAFFRDAIARDRGFALAITGLSEACALSGVFGMVPPIPAFEEARTAARRALELQPNLPSALTAMGHVFTQRDRNWSGGRDLYERALRLAPATAWSHAWLALNLVQSGSAAAAIEQIARARQIEPAVAPFMALSGLILYHARDFAAARRQLQDILEAAPDAVLPRHFLARVLLAENDAPGAIRLLEGRNDQAPGSYSTLGRAYAMVGNRDGARAEIARVEVEGRNGFGVGYDLALLHLALGDHERAFAGLERGIDDCSQMLGYINVDPALDPIRNEPRVRAVARRIGLA